MTRRRLALRVGTPSVAAADATARRADVPAARWRVDDPAPSLPTESRPTIRVTPCLQPSGAKPLQLAARDDERVERRSIEGEHVERADGLAERRGAVAAPRPRRPDEARGVAIEAALGFDGDAELAPVLPARGEAAGLGKVLQCA